MATYKTAPMPMMDKSKMMSQKEMSMKGSVDKQAVAKQCKENNCPVPDMKNC